MSDILVQQDSIDHRILENQTRMALKMKEEEGQKINYLVPKPKKSESSERDTGPLKDYGGEGTRHQPRLSLHPTLSNREYEQMPSGPNPSGRNQPLHNPGNFAQLREEEDHRGGRGSNSSHFTNFETRAQDLWRESSEKYDSRQDRWLGEDRQEEKNRLKTMGQLKDTVRRDLEAGTMMSMITMSRGPEGLQSLSDQDLHLVTEGWYDRMSRVRHNLKETHAGVSKSREEIAREFLGEVLTETLTSMDGLFMDKDLWYSVLGGGDKAEDFVEETIGLATFIEYTKEHGGKPGDRDPLYHRQMRTQLIRWYAVMEMGLKELLSLKELINRAADRLNQHVEKHPLLSRTKSERVKAQLGVHYMRKIGHDLVNNSDLPFGFMRNLQNHSDQLDEYGYAREDQVLDDLEDEVSNESIWDQILREQEHQSESQQGKGSRARTVADNRSPQRGHSQGMFLPNSLTQRVKKEPNYPERQDDRSQSTGSGDPSEVRSDDRHRKRMKTTRTVRW